MLVGLHAVIDYVASSKEIMAALLSASLSCLGFLILRIFAAKPKLHYAVAHRAHLLPKNNEGKMFSVFSAEYMFFNVGRKLCESVEFVFNFPPQHFEIFPYLPYAQHLNPDNRLIITIPLLNPGESFKVYLLNSPTELPDITSVRFKGGAGKIILLEQQRKYSKFVGISVAFLILIGIMALVYAPIRIAQALF